MSRNDEDFFEDSMNLSEKETEIMKSYENTEEEEEYQEFTDVGILEKNKRVQKIMNIILTIILIIMILSIIDIIAVVKYNKGPFFAIPTVQYKDGGTKEYYGLGYKVISYHQIQGRRDKELGFWNLQYNTNAITIQDLDLAIELKENRDAFYQNYYRKFVRVISTLQEVDLEKYQIRIGYLDEDEKYSLNIICDIAKDQIGLDTLEVGKPITIIGTMSKWQNQELYVTNCFAEQ